jgi:hypothetical protein
MLTGRQYTTPTSQLAANRLAVQGSGSWGDFSGWGSTSSTAGAGARRPQQQEEDFYSLVSAWTSQVELISLKQPLYTQCAQHLQVCTGVYMRVPVSFGAHACRVWVQDDLLKDAGSKVSDFVQQVDWSRLQDVPVGVAGWVQQQGERLRTKGIVSGTPPEQSLCVVACLGSAPHWRCCCMVCQSLPHRWQRSTTCMTC